MSDSYAARLERVVELVARDTDAARLDASDRRTLGELWRHRATAEITAARMFEGLARDCSSHDVPAAVTELIERAIGDERYHSELSARVAELYLGERLAAPTPFADALRFESCEAELALGLRLLLHCALNESVSVAYLTECHREAVSPLMRAATRELLRDEIDHARVGWAYLAAQRFASSANERFCRELPALITLVTTPSGA